MLRHAAATLALLALAACGTTSPTRAVRHHGLGGSSLVYVEAFDVGKVQTVGRTAAATPGELASRLRVRLLQELRDLGMQTRDADGAVPRDGILVRGSIDTIDGGTTEGVQVGGQRVHCTVQLFNGAEDRSDPAVELKITGTPTVAEAMKSTTGILGAAEDAADQIADYIHEHP